MTLIVITGVGTDIGKTHVTAALSLAWGRTWSSSWLRTGSGSSMTCGPWQKLVGVADWHWTASC